MGLSGKEIDANDNVGGPAEKPGSKRLYRTKSAGKPRNADDWGISPLKAPPQFCLFLSLKRHLQNLPLGASFPGQQPALYTVPVQLPGAFPEGIAKISSPVLLLRRQDSKKIQQ